MRSPRRGLAVALGALLLLMIPAGALAQDVDELILGDDTAGVPMGFLAEAMYPTASESRELIVRIAEGREPATVAIIIDDVEDWENGCIRPELQRGDRSCGDAVGNGELSRQLVLDVEVAGPPVDGVCPASGRRVLSERLITVGDGLIGVVESLAGGEAVCLRMTVTVPDLPENNLMMTDSVSWRLTVSAEADDSVAVLGNVIAAPSLPMGVSPVAPETGGSSVLGNVLATTGAPLVRLLALAFLLLTTGLILRSSGLTRRRSPFEVADW